MTTETDLRAALASRADAHEVALLAAERDLIAQFETDWIVPTHRRAARILLPLAAAAAVAAIAVPLALRTGTDHAQHRPDTPAAAPNRGGVVDRIAITTSGPILWSLRRNVEFAYVADSDVVHGPSGYATVAAFPPRAGQAAARYAGSAARVRRLPDGTWVVVLPDPGLDCLVHCIPDLHITERHGPTRVPFRLALPAGYRLNAYAYQTAGGRAPTIAALGLSLADPRGRPFGLIAPANPLLGPTLDFLAVSGLANFPRREHGATFPIIAPKMSSRTSMFVPLVENRALPPTAPAIGRGLRFVVDPVHPSESWPTLAEALGR